MERLMAQSDCDLEEATPHTNGEVLTVTQISQIYS